MSDEHKHQAEYHAVLILGLVALLRARREDIPEVVQAIGHWLRGTPPPLPGRRPQKR